VLVFAAVRVRQEVRDIQGREILGWVDEVVGGPPVEARYLAVSLFGVMGAFTTREAAIMWHLHYAAETAARRRAHGTSWLRELLWERGDGRSMLVDSVGGSPGQARADYPGAEWFVYWRQLPRRSHPHRDGAEEALRALAAVDGFIVDEASHLA
jgi:hypothetical protein